MKTEGERERERELAVPWDTGTAPCTEIVERTSPHVWTHHGVDFFSDLPLAGKKSPQGCDTECDERLGDHLSKLPDHFGRKIRKIARGGKWKMDGISIGLPYLLFTREGPHSVG